MRSNHADTGELDRTGVAGRSEVCKVRSLARPRFDSDELSMLPFGLAAEVSDVDAASRGKTKESGARQSGDASAQLALARSTDVRESNS